MLAHEPRRHEQLEQIRQRANPKTAWSRSDRHEYALGGHVAPPVRQPTIPHAIEYQVVSLGASGEIFPAVIDDEICANRSDEVHVPRAAHSRYLCAERFSDLHSERTDTPRRTIDQDLLPRLNPTFVAKPLQSCQPRHRYGRRLLEGQVHGNQRQPVFASADIFGKGALARAEHRISWFKPRDVPADRFDISGQIDSRTG